MKRLRAVLRQTAFLYAGKRGPRAAAALSYHLTMTLFPLIICLYALLGHNYESVLRILNFVEQFLSADAARTIRIFIRHVASSNGRAILIAGVTVLITSASAAVRTLQSGIGEMQGGQRFQGLTDYLFSILFSFVFLAAMYFSIVVLLTGRDFLEWIGRILPFINASSSWPWLRFLLLGGIGFVIFWGVYKVSQRRRDRYSCWPGALFSTLAIVAMSFVFSLFIAASARYPLVYGSLASIVLIMLWLYFSCQIIFMGAALNVAIRDAREKAAPEEAKTEEKNL